VGGRQLPLPSQCDVGVNVEPLHDCEPHDTVAAAIWQAPAPLHMPVSPQGGFGVQRPIVSGLPVGTKVHLPALVPTLHAWQSEHELVPQQTPSTQKLPVRQSLVAVQAWPRRFLLPHLLVGGSQMLGDRQSLSVLHAARQAVVPLHW